MDFTAPSFSLGFDSDEDEPASPIGSDRREQPRGYAAPDAPSFSLGIDLDDGVDEEPQIPAGGRREEQARRSAAPDPPSFSLGFDDDGGEEEEPCTPAAGRREERERGPAASDSPSFSLGFDDDDDDDCEILVSGQRHQQTRQRVAPRAPTPAGAEDEDDDLVLDGSKQPSPETNRFKRLRKGPVSTPQVRRCEVPDAPSFSLGISDDDDEFLAGVQHQKQPRSPAAPRAPTSFSFEDEGDFFRRPEAAQREVAPTSAAAEDEDDDFVLAGSKQPPSETNQFKRLRKGPAPAYPAPSLQVRRCEAPDAPSFSLGISDDDDDDFLADGQHQKQPRTPLAPRAPSSFSAGDQRPEPAQHGMTPLKRLRKGPVPPHLAPTPPPLKVPGPPAAKVFPLMSDHAAMDDTGSLEDDIEDWTTDEERPVRDVPPSVGSCSTSSNTTFSLLNRGILKTQSASKANTTRATQTPNFSASKVLEESCTKKLLPKVTISPMRKIHLLDSDTDAEDEQNQNKAKKPVGPVKERQETMHKYMQEKPTFQENRKPPQGSTTVQKSEAIMNNNWATPAFDEFCNEYFASTKDVGSSQQKEGNNFCCSKVSQRKYPDEMEGHFQQQSTSSGGVLDDNLDNQPPAMHYLFHHDPRVRDLVSGRLQHFIPVGAGSTRENEQCRGESHSYRKQFHSSAAANNEWVAPNRGIPVPTDVGKRRVHASGTQSGSGHWFTNDSGRKVYVSKNGEELTGRDGYRQYQKESGRRFNRYKKKCSSGTKRGAAKVKVETGAKQGSSGTKRGAAKVKSETAAKQGTHRAKRKR